MKFNASLDRTAKVITAATFILFGFLTVLSVRDIADANERFSVTLLNCAVILFLIVILLICWMYSTRYYTYENKALVIHRPLGNRIIPVSEIESVQLVDRSEMSRTIRAFGVGGLFGYFGKFIAPRFGTMTAYATQMRNLMLIRTKKGELVLLSPDDLHLADMLRQ